MQNQMKKIFKILTFLFLVLINTNCLATFQTGDLLIIENDTVAIFQYPLNVYFNKGNIYNPEFFTNCLSTGCWRGYKAIWIIKDNKLFLKDIYDCCLKEKISIDRIGLPKNEEGLIFAYWFDGNFKINLQIKQEIIFHQSFDRLFMRKIIIKISKGHVTKMRHIFKNQKDISFYSKI
jgi:hypothetical protein